MKTELKYTDKKELAKARRQNQEKRVNLILLSAFYIFTGNIW